jgi:hypothetical protein
MIPFPSAEYREFFVAAPPAVPTARTDRSRR